MTEEIEKTTAPAVVSESELEELGFKTAAAGVKTKREIARKMRIAFEHFRVVTPEHISRFNDELRKRTEVKGSVENGWIGHYQTLAFTPVEKYSEVPPAEALAKLKEARELKCFDTYVVATIDSVTVVPDPVLFGQITGCQNYYYIAQWDDDVKIEDILKEDEG
jgi:hypothetical protein